MPPSPVAERITSIRGTCSDVTHVKNTYYYQCEQDGPYLKSRPKGCITHDKRNKIAIGQRDDFGDYT
ncbi:hypothetical protein ANCDUO_26954 [Ancylostoma duodenale]|uniref:Abnormal cell migration protein 18-like fibronectin type I domain-containing protein n=1 Tax=Ancylostoma duodenale TaxID=51022 RepID=A0A0C2FDC1_9BILA|nr:hypothetical protein ANCDUO_26954 [Ancylostoma duodenale]